MQNRTIKMSEESFKEWQQSFKDVEDSIDELEKEELQVNPYAKYLKDETTEA